MGFSRFLCPEAEQESPRARTGVAMSWLRGQEGDRAAETRYLRGGNWPEPMATGRRWGCPEVESRRGTKI